MSRYTKITRKKLNIITKNKAINYPHKMSTNDLIDTIDRYDSKRKSYSNWRKLRKVGPNSYIKKQIISENDLRKAAKLHNMSIDDLKKTAILQRIKNYDKLLREDLIYTLLRWEGDLIECDYEKYITNNTNDETKSKINYIRILLSRLGNIITKDDRNKIRKNLYEIEKKQKLTKTQKEKFLNHLIELANALNKKKRI